MKLLVDYTWLYVGTDGIFLNGNTAYFASLLSFEDMNTIKVVLRKQVIPVD